MFSEKGNYIARLVVFTSYDGRLSNASKTSY